MDKAKRDRAIHEAIVRRSSTHTASYPDLHHPTVSRIVKQVDVAQETSTEKT